ncbi:MAG TPA: flagellin [Phycisphaerae bacterium]|nr:flagellin [Phycisphaerae bacterium]
MSISSAGSLSRVSTSLRTYTLISQLQRSTLQIFQDEQRISSGQRLLSVGDDPIAAEKIARLMKSLEGQDQILTNIRSADGFLATADTAISEISDLLNDAARIASEQAGSLQSTEERTAQASVIEGIIAQLQNIGNRRYQNQYLFGGRNVDVLPLNDAAGRTTFAADQGDRRTVVDFASTLRFNLTTSELFGTREAVIGGDVAFDVQLNVDGRLSELRGANGTGIGLGQVQITETGPNVQFTVDFAGAETVRDVIARFNDAAAAAGSGLTLAINPADGTTLRVTPPGGSGIAISDVGSGTTAADLGIEQTVGAGVAINGLNLDRRMTLTTELGDLGAGGIALPSGMTITNGGVTRTVSFAGAATVQDVLNAINNSGVHVRARINDAGDGFELENLAAGTTLLIGENGGADAATLGLRTLAGSTPLSRLNNGRGIHPVDGNDLRITNANGVAFDVDLSGAVDVQDVLDAINTASTAAGAGVVADIAPNGAGLRLTGPAGPNPITVTSPNPPLSPVAGELGLDVTGTSTVLDGSQVGGFTQTGIFSALYRLRDGLLADDGADITQAGTLINEAQKRVANAAGQVGARSRDMQSRVTQLEDAVAATGTLLSELRDVDFVEAVARFQQAQTALQATLLTGSKTLNLSLLNYLQ